MVIAEILDITFSHLYFIQASFLLSEDGIDKFGVFFMVRKVVKFTGSVQYYVVPMANSYILN